MPNSFHLGAHKDKKDPRDFLFGSVVSPVALPPIIDYEAKMTSVKDQHRRGACVAFAACAVKEYQEYKQSGKPVDLSEEFVYDNVGSPHGGAYPRDAMRLLVDRGVCPEDVWPYQVSADDQNPPPWIPWVMAKHRPLYIQSLPYKAKGYVRLTSEHDMMNSLILNGPFLLAVSWLDGWFGPTEKDAQGYPILRPGQGKNSGGHALCCVGYDQVAKTFKFKNSWSRVWGKDGYAKFSFDVIEANLNDSWASFDLGSPSVIQSALPEKYRVK